MAKFEAHMTFNRRDAGAVSEVGEAFGWKFSAFDADPIMGDKPHCYLTAYHTRAEELARRMDDIEDALKAHSVTTLRKKVERIVYDTKTGIDEVFAHAKGTSA